MKILIVLLIAFVSVGLYSNTLHYEFTQDDLIHISNNPDIKSLDSKAAEGYFNQPIYPGNLYRPLVTLSYAITHHFFGLDPFCYHLTNLVLHILASLALLSVLSRIFHSTFAAVVALLFSIHPIHVEAVVNVSGRAELLAAFFGLLAVGAALTLDREPWEKVPIISGIAASAGIFLFLLAALFSKESALTFVLILPLIYCWKRGFGDGIRRSILPLFVMAAACSVYATFRMNALGGTLLPTLNIDPLDNPLASLSVSDRILNALLLLGQYIRLIIIPNTFGADYSLAQLPVITDWFTLDWNNALLIVNAGFIALLLLSALLGPIRGKTHGFFALWFLFTFLLTSNVIFPIGTIFGERLAYMPSVGVIGAVTLAIFALNLDFLAGIFFSLLTVLYFAQSIIQTRYWKDSESLYTHQIEVSPNSAKAHSNYAVVLRNLGKLGEAESHYREALHIYPNYADATFGIGTTYVMREDLDSAAKWFHKALVIDSSHPPSLILLGQITLNQGQNLEARTFFTKVLEHNPKNIDARLGMLAVNINLGALNEAKSTRDKLVTEYPQNEELNRLSKVLDNKLSAAEAAPQ